MKLNDLNQNQILQLKQAYLCNVKYENTGVSWGMLAHADSIVTMEEIQQYYGNIDFSEDDFSQKGERKWEIK